MGSKNKKKSKNKVEVSSAGEVADDGGSHQNNGNSNGKTITDDRFASLHSDPRFREAPKNKAKVAIDSRFNRMFTDKSFASSKAPVDKRGKPKKKEIEAESLKHYYRLEDEEEEERAKRIKRIEKLFKDEESEGSEDDGSHSSGSEESESESESEEDKGKKRNLKVRSESEESESQEEGSDDSSTSTTDSDEEDDEVFDEEEGVLAQVEMYNLA